MDNLEESQVFRLQQRRRLLDERIYIDRMEAVLSRFPTTQFQNCKYKTLMSPFICLNLLNNTCKRLLQYRMVLEESIPELATSRFQHLHKINLLVLEEEKSVVDLSDIDV